MTVKNWGICGPQSPYQDPATSIKLSGEVFDHPSFPDGSPILTSRVSRVEQKDEQSAAVFTAHSEYTIFAKDVHPEYEKMFPDAFARLMAAQRQ